jgi:hypothetical protein
MHGQRIETELPRRRHNRRAVELPAQLTFGGSEIQAITENISPGGALLNVALPPGTNDVVACINLRTGRQVRVRARVRWRRVTPPGVGIEFNGFFGPHEKPG